MFVFPFGGCGRDNADLSSCIYQKFETRGAICDVEEATRRMARHTRRHWWLAVAFPDLEHGSWHFRAASPKRWWYQHRLVVDCRCVGFGEGERRRRVSDFTRLVRLATSERSCSISVVRCGGRGLRWKLKV